MNIRVIFIISMILSIILMAQMDFGFSEVPHLTPPTELTLWEPRALMEMRD